MHLEILVEEYSAEIALNNLLSRLITGDHTYRIITSQGKSDLLKKLPQKLRGYRKWITNDMKIVVLLDRDNQDCHQLKSHLTGIAEKAGLLTKTSAPDTFDIMIRLAIEELEAWFFGDFEAMLTAYPRIDQNFHKKAKFRNPDKITGGTWEALEALLKAAGYYKNGYRKIEASDTISKYMEPLKNRSKSFQVFWTGINELVDN